MAGTSNKQKLVARIRHRGSANGVTEVVIDRIDQDVKWKVIEFIRKLKLEPVYSQSSGQDTFVSVDVSMARSKEVCAQIVSFMETIGVDDVSVSSAHYEDKLPEIESESGDDFFTDYTLAGSDDVKEIANKNDSREESEIEIIIANPVAWEASQQGSSDLITLIRQESNVDQNRSESLSNSPEETQQEEMATPMRNTENVAVQSSLVKKPSWWAKKTRRLTSFFRRSKAKEHENVRIVNRLEICGSREVFRRKMQFKRKGSLFSELYGSNINIGDHKTSNNTNIEELHNQIEQLKKVNPKKYNVIMHKYDKLSAEMFTQTRHTKKDREISTQTKKRLKDQPFSLHTVQRNKTPQYNKSSTLTPLDSCCEDYEVDQTYSRSSPERIEHSQPFRDLRNTEPNPVPVFDSFPFIPQPLFYIMPASRLDQNNHIFANNFQKRILNTPSCVTGTSSCRYSTTNDYSSVTSPKVHETNSGVRNIYIPTTTKNTVFKGKHFSGRRKKSKNIGLQEEKPNSIKEKLSNEAENNTERPNIRKVHREYKTSKQFGQLPIEKQLLLINEKLDKLAMLEKEETQQASYNECKTNMVDIGVECKELTDVPVECIQKVDVYSECDLPSDLGTLNSSSTNISFPNMKNNRKYNVSKRASNRKYNIDGLKRAMPWNGFPYSTDHKDFIQYPRLGWRSDSTGLPLLPTDYTSKKLDKKKYSNRKCCPLFCSRKKALKKQLMKQKLELNEIKMIIAAINNQIQNQPFSSTEEDMYSEDTDGEDDDIQFSFSRPNKVKKTVTFRSPLVE